MSKLVPVVVEHRKDLIVYTLGGGRQILQPLAPEQLNLFEPTEDVPVFDGKDSQPACVLKPARFAEILKLMSPALQNLSWRQVDPSKINSPYIMKSNIPEATLQGLCKR